MNHRPHTTRRVSRRRPLAGIALLVALSMGACSTGGWDRAATVDGRHISDAELQTAAAEMTEVTSSSTTPAQVLSLLALAPVLEGVVAGSPAAMTVQEAEELLAGAGLTDASGLTVEVARAQVYLSTLNDPATLQDPAYADVAERAAQITAEDLAAVDVEVSPRYGTWDPESASVLEETPEWIAPATGAVEDQR